MPLLTLDITNAPLSVNQRVKIQQGLTKLMSTLLSKVADLTVIHIRETLPYAWSVGGRMLSDAQWCASLNVAITEGTNTAQQQASFLAAAHDLLTGVIGGPPAAPLYIVVQGLPAAQWGYGGRTQASRQAKPASAELPLTLMQLSGVSDIDALTAKGTALLLIDFQREYEHEGQIPLSGIGAAAHEAQRLARIADDCGLPVFHVHHVAAQSNAALFDRDSSGVAPCLEPEVRSHHMTLIKHWPSAFHETSLRQELRQRSIHTVVLAGCMTHNCVDSTARHALHLGLRVIIAEDACATRALPTGDHTVITAETVHQAALAALADRHATVLPTREIVSLLSLTAGRSTA